MNRFIGSLLVAGSILAAATTPRIADATSFTFAGVTFVQESTPDVLGLLGGSAVFGGAAFSSGNATDITQSVGFLAQPGGSPGAGFTPLTGFLPELSLGRQGNAQHGLDQPNDGTSCLFACAINLPAGNNGAVNRHGLDVSWSGGRNLANGAGLDFVVYESGSAGTPEGFMARVHLVGGGYSSWLFKTNAGNETYVGTADVAFATVFDLSDFGLAAEVAIDGIQIANLKTGDTLGAGGLVLFDGSGTAHGFGPTALDPDPLYVGVLRALNSPVSAPNGVAFFGLGLVALSALRRRCRSAGRQVAGVAPA